MNRTLQLKYPESALSGDPAFYRNSNQGAGS